MNKIEYIGKCLLLNANKKRILVIGDLHLGYEEALRGTGVAIPSSAYDETLADLDKIFNKTGKVDEIVIIGDLKHEFGRISREEWNDVLRFIDYLTEKLEKEGKVVIIKGNHDIIIEPIANKRNILVADYYIDDGFCFLHGDYDFEGKGEIYDKNVTYWIMGHAHPAIVISDTEEVKHERYKCFLVGNYKGREVIVIPSFFPLIEGTDVSKTNAKDLGLAWEFNLDNFNVKVVDVDSLNVLDFGKLKKIK